MKKNTCHLLVTTTAELCTFLISLLLGSLLIFLALQVLPGDASTVLGGTDATPEQLARIRSQLGLDKPWPVQYADWLIHAAQGDLGVSQLSHMSVSDQLGRKLVVTFPRCVMGIALSVLAGCPCPLSSSGSSSPPPWGFMRMPFRRRDSRRRAGPIHRRRCAH